MRLTRVLFRLLAVFLVSCRTPPPVIAPDLRSAEALRAADALVNAGCLDCLIEAYDAYRALETRPAVAPQANRGAYQSAALIAIRERELGLEDGGYLASARERLRGRSEAEAASDAHVLEIIDTLPGLVSRGQVPSDQDIARRRTALSRRDEFREFLSARADSDPLSAYVWVSFNCGFPVSRPGEDEGVEPWLQAAPQWRPTALLTFRAATCRTLDVPSLRRLVESNPRFAEVTYFIGLVATQEGRLDDGLAEWLRAYAWRSRWATLTHAMAEAYLTLDEDERALDFFEQTLAVPPVTPAALLGRARALTYLERYQESLAVVDQLLAMEQWYPGDARYWRALNETQLERYDAAWDDVELAARLLVNADVPKLAGIIAYRRGQRDVARAKFEEAWRRNGADCEIGVHLSIVLSDQRVWADALSALNRTGACLDRAEAQLHREIERIRVSDDPPARRAKQIADREARIATGARLLVTVWFNAAVASFYSARMDDARQFAARVLDDAEFGTRAQALLARIPH